MFRNKLFNMALIIMVSIALLAVVALVGWQYLGDREAAAKAPKPPTAQELAERQFAVDKMTTNLSGSSLIQIGMTLQTDSRKTVEELGLRKLQVKDTINQILHSTTHVDIQNDRDYRQLRQKIKDGVNKYLQTGKVVDVYITDIVIQ
ncbi:flagellar basal body-associated FliL family protein [Effusibacillus pohliae]|uniref:flagellar basal body-associated FliL family protein n=1 Tax=Effusibacillus pohliae TaxID=232270 RepID=UPI00036842E2|nr:flagellar basal body-associated FliL family protein [Effusibacillus pohliae]